MNRDYGGLDALGSKHVAPRQSLTREWGVRLDLWGQKTCFFEEGIGVTAPKCDMNFLRSVLVSGLVF